MLFVISICDSSVEIYPLGYSICDLVAGRSSSCSFQLLREQVEVRYTTATVEVFFKGQRVSSHQRRYDGQPSTVAEHMPSAHRAHAEWTPSRLIRWAETVGPATGALVARILESRPHPEQGHRIELQGRSMRRTHRAPKTRTPETT